MKWIVGALALAGVLGFAGYRWLAAGNEQPAGETRFLPLIAEVGRKDHAVISPDESRIAFVWDGGRGAAEFSPTDIYVKVIGTDGPPLGLTTAPENDAMPCWTPDGKYVTFVRERPGKGEVLRVPASGGPEQKLAETSTSASWSPDGRTLAVTGLIGSAEGQSVLLVNLETGRRTRLTTPEPSTVDYYPAFSPDGKMVAFIRDFGANQVDICVVPADGGALRQLTFEKNRVSGLAWTSDSREIVFGAIRRGTRGLWRISAQGGTPALVPVNTRYPINPDISRQGNKLVWTEFSNDANLWLYQGGGFTGRDVPGNSASPDGRRLLFARLEQPYDELMLMENFR